jgi:hypothetical protein
MHALAGKNFAREATKGAELSLATLPLEIAI